jgi:two-component system, NarL family, response regulator DesR
MRAFAYAAGQKKIDTMCHTFSRTEFTQKNDLGCVAPAGKAAIRVLVAEDVRVLRDALVALLSLEEDIDVVAALASGDGIVPAALEHRPDVALLDIDLPDVDGLDAAAELAERAPTCRSLILTGMATPDNIRRAVAAGVSGFLLKDGPTEGLISAIRAVARGEQVISPRLA